MYIHIYIRIHIYIYIYICVRVYTHILKLDTYLRYIRGNLRYMILYLYQEHGTVLLAVIEAPTVAEQPFWASQLLPKAQASHVDLQKPPGPSKQNKWTLFCPKPTIRG